MMVGALLARGMIVGFIAGLLVFCFLKIVGEPPLEQAIAYEASQEQAQKRDQDQNKMKADTRRDNLPASVTSKSGNASDQEPVSRAVQSGPGLLAGVGVYGAATGGLFALAYALAYGRMGAFSARATSALIAAAGFVAVSLIPFLKYPANPPAVGTAETIGMRTGLYFVLIFISLAAIIAAGIVRARLYPRLGGWESALIAGGAYSVAMCLVLAVLPGINEIPETFPAHVLWQFRVAAIGAQLILWTFVGLVFGAWADVAERRRYGFVCRNS